MTKSEVAKKVQWTWPVNFFEGDTLKIDTFLAVHSEKNPFCDFINMYTQYKEIKDSELGPEFLYYNKKEFNSSKTFTKEVKRFFKVYLA